MNIIIILPKTSDREKKILKSSQKNKTHYVMKKKEKGKSRFFAINNENQWQQGTMFNVLKEKKPTYNSLPGKTTFQKYL